MIHSSAPPTSPASAAQAPNAVPTKKEESGSISDEPQGQIRFIETTLRDLKQAIEASGYMKGHLPYVDLSLTALDDLGGSDQSRQAGDDGPQHQLDHVENTLKDLQRAIESTGFLRRHQPYIALSLKAVGEISERTSSGVQGAVQAQGRPDRGAPQPSAVPVSSGTSEPFPPAALHAGTAVAASAPAEASPPRKRRPWLGALILGGVTHVTVGTLLDMSGLWDRRIGANPTGCMGFLAGICVALAYYHWKQSRQAAQAQSTRATPGSEPPLPAPTASSQPSGSALMAPATTGSAASAGETHARPEAGCTDYGWPSYH